MVFWLVLPVGVPTTYGLLIGLCMGCAGHYPICWQHHLPHSRVLDRIRSFLCTPHLSQKNPWSYVGAVVGIFVVVQQINSLVTAPKIVGESVGLHPMTVIFSMLFWSLLLGGFIGALLAVPLTAALKVLFRRYVSRTQTDGASASISK